MYTEVEGGTIILICYLITQSELSTFPDIEVWVLLHRGSIVAAESKYHTIQKIYQFMYNS